VSGQGDAPVPGIHFVYSDDNAPLQNKYESSLDALLHDRGYTKEILFRDSTAQLGVTRYPEYPLVVLNSDDYFVILEGRIYGRDKTAVHNDLVALAGYLFSNDNRVISRIREWLFDHDGDFLILARQKQTGRWAFLNDALGRLPVYSCRKKGLHYLSREIRFIADQLDSLNLDRMAIAQHLLFGFPLGVRTVICNVERVPPATLLSWGDSTEGPEQYTIHEFNFEDKRSAQPVRTTAEELVSLFTDACRGRTDADRQSVLSLSGGLDSRSVAAGLLRAGCPFQAVTFEDILGRTAPEVDGAREVAGRLNIGWNLVHLRAPTGRDIQQILRVKSGLIQTTMAFDVPYMQEIENLFGRAITYFSGDGGDQLMPSLQPARRFRSTSDLAKFIINRFHILPPDMVSDLMGLSASEITTHLESVMESYPEETSNQKLVHFMIYELGIRWLFEGEDRNRCCFWSCTPFYSLPFFQMAMQCPDEQKKHHHLYREFLQQLSPEAAAVTDAKRGVPITSPAYRRKTMLISLAARYPRLLRKLQGILQTPATYPVTSPIVRCLRRQVTQCPAIGDYFHKPALEQLSEHPGQLSRDVFDNLFTVTTMIEHFCGSEDSLDHFADTDFI